MALIGEMRYLQIGNDTYSLPAGGNGTVTSVGISNATNGGLTVSGSPIGTSGTITLGHSNVLTNAQTTQALYPIKIDKNGHISSYGTAVSVPTTAGNSTTGISIGAHGTTSIGSASGWSAGSASTWTFEEKSIPNVTSAGSASTWTFEEKSIPNVTSVGSASTWAFTGVTVANSIAGAVDANDNSQLNISVGTTTVQSKSSGSNGTAPTLGTAIKVQSKSGGANGSAPTLGTAIKVQSKSGGANGTAPSLTVTSKTVVTGSTHTITDEGHTHSLT